jgi:putative sigma-54 modulation protein
MIQNMTTLPIHITPHHLSLSQALRDFVCLKLAKVSQFAGDALAADIVLRRHHGTANGKRFSASARLALPGRDIHASATHADLYTAVVRLVATLARRSRKRNTRLAKTHTQRRAGNEPNSAAKSVASRLVSENAVLQADEPLLQGRVHRSRRQEGGQELRVYGFRRRSPFACAPDS